MPQEGGRLDAKRHYVILAKALDGIWPVGHACAVLCWGTRRRGGYIGEKLFQEFGPRFFDMSSSSGYVEEKYVQQNENDISLIYM